MNPDGLINFFNKYIKKTPYKGNVKGKVLSICCINSLDLSITTKSLKHLFDKKPAEEFNCVLNYIHLILLYPHSIYRNNAEKRGQMCFVKKIKGFEYFCSIEIISSGELQVATCFRLRDRDYLKNYTLLWNWGSGIPHRHAIDSIMKSIGAPQ